jgi:hypothetical protein
MHLAHVLHAAGAVDEALAAAREAADLYAQKGATVLVQRTNELIAGWSASA